MTDPEFREAYGQNKDVLYRFACRMTGSPETAEDLVHECFLAWLGKPAAFDQSRGALRSFLIGIIRNLALKQLRGSRAFDELTEETATSRPIDPVGRERAACVAEAIAALPPLQREALILAEYEELPLAEIAGITGAELAAVKSRLHRARTSLKVMLAPLANTKGTTYGTHG